MDLLKTLKIATLLLFVIFISNASYAQIPMGVDPNNLSDIRIDELSDDQIIAIFKQGESSGFTLEQAQSIAIKRGLPTSEARKLKERMELIQKKQPSNNLKVNNTETSNENNLEALNENSLEKKSVKKETSKLPLDSLIKSNTHKSNIYGLDYFRNGNVKLFDKSTDAKAPMNYIIGVGDEMAVSVFGYSYYNEILKVDSRGAINPNQMGPIFIKGLTLEKAKVLIRSKMGQYFDFNNNKLEVTLNYSRSITVNIVGEVISPGSYKMPAVNTAFNALIFAGGPSDVGSLRNIQIRRNGKTIKSLDLYSFLFDPDTKQDYFLEDNDYIVVTTSKKSIKMIGEIVRPATYELLENENLNAILKYTGGLNSNAYKEKIQIRRNTDKEVKIIDLNLDSLLKSKGDYKLFNGDEITVKASISEIFNKISLIGAVNFPGEYNYVPGQKVLDVIKTAGDIKIEAEVENAYLIRTNPNQTKEYIRLNLREIYNNPSSSQNIVLQALDQINIFSTKTFIDELFVTTYGSVKNPKKIPFIYGMTLDDVLRQSGGFTLDAENLRIEISRLNYFSPEYIDGQDVRVVVEKVQLPENRLNMSMDKTILLYPFDEVFIRSVPHFDAQQNIELKGEVKYPGTYALLSKDEKVSSVIKRAGGLTKYAFTEGATFYRKDVLGGLVVFKLSSAINDKNSKYDYVLKEGDVITVPPVTDFVQIRGTSIEYLNFMDRPQVNAPFVKGRRANYYINKFGNGFTTDAWRKKTYVVQPNAKINRTKDFLVFKIYPKVTKGSTIHVVKKVKKIENTTEKKPFDWNKFIENSMVKLTGVATLYILFTQLK